ncbi:hypothetical protein GY45DRAFT_118203 [Cubamyces sp. BRFM 1775]|nr:hypothetical protein GY45DRAFT_118203 [Cubamyces sp. BRFM 1775]
MGHSPRHGYFPYLPLGSAFSFASSRTCVFAVSQCARPLLQSPTALQAHSSRIIALAQLLDLSSPCLMHCFPETPSPCHRAGRHSIPTPVAPRQLFRMSAQKWLCRHPHVRKYPFPTLFVNPSHSRNERSSGHIPTPDMTVQPARLVSSVNNEFFLPLCRQLLRR